MMNAKQIIFAVLGLLTYFCALTVVAKEEQKVLVVLSSNGEDAGDVAPGFEFDEFAKAYLVFKRNGLHVDIASPAGGAPIADKYDADKPYNAEVLADPTAMQKLKQTLATSAVDASDYAAVFVVGGKGAMFDLPKDKALQHVIADIWQQDGVVAAVCHGPAALVDIKLADGSYLVADKEVNSFTNEEEQLFGKKWINEFAFLLEDKLIERGAKFESSEIMLSHVAVDGRLITGQNPTSTVDVANKVVEKLGLTPVQSTPYTEDRTLTVIAEFLAGDGKAITKFEHQPEQYQMNLIGMYGYYYTEVANTDSQLERALDLMQVAQSSLKHPKLDMKIAQTQQQLGEVAAAKGTLKTLLKSQPDFQPAIDMLKSLSI
ncbi:type 1 glutamine amidotransferase domain-containing protein [Alteromonas sp. ASW11-130]|uniref:type 1 glutamine amidotransferase domain-containing protein n=1 Tax=Alteromonas sp. ASW11-130 TaxID=3015775 RepID=UPI0022424F88|nr:type 1 glutamine amidotransferase domain-containing protein [Alteromonas sp. ASW11-130]MCW8093312.1 type 1 glutamine amidotransferase domain-containing protein [Alteromonas sp. ASW11-130]